MKDIKPMTDDEIEAHAVSRRGAKYDQGKPQLALLDFTFLEGIAKVREFGVKKYKDPESWKNVPNARYRYLNATLRHLFAMLKGEECDKDSGLKHLYHIGCNIMFLGWFDNETDKLSENIKTDGFSNTIK